MFKIKCVLSYDGSNYYGWQRQRQFPSIQEIVEKTFSKIFQKKITIHGSGRTDRNVHAKSQVISTFIPKKFPTENLKKSLNAILPDDISIHSISYEEESFHARYDAKGKVYSYTINTSKINNPFTRNFQYHHPYPIDISLINNALPLFIGKKDFSSFANSRPGYDTKNKNSNVRTIYSIELKKEEDKIILYFHGDGFLYKMVRNIVGALIDIGEKKVTLEQVEEILEKKSNIHILRQAVPHGLCLEKVFYT